MKLEALMLIRKFLSKESSPNIKMVMEMNVLSECFEFVRKNTF